MVDILNTRTCSADVLERLIQLEANAPTFHQAEIAQMNLSSWLVSRRHSILAALRAQAGEKSWPLTNPINQGEPQP